MVKSKRASLNLAVAFVAIAAFLSYMNYLTPLFADDFSYSVSFATKKPLASVYDLYQSQYLHYFTTNGRIPIHAMAQVLLWIGKPVLNVINGAVFAAFCLLICYHGLGAMKKIRGYHLLVVFGALWFLTPHFGGSYLWVMGAANYLYSPTLILCFFIPYRRAMRDGAVEKSRHPLLLAVGNAMLGVLAGWSNENTSLALIVMVAAVIAIHIVAKKKVNPWMWTGLAGNIIGCGILFLSPAQAKRLDAAGGFGDLSQWIIRFLSISLNVLRYLWLPMLVFVVAFILVLRGTKRAPKRSLAELIWHLGPAMVFTLGTGISVYAMVGSPEFPVWVWSSILALALIAAMNMVYAINPADVKLSPRVPLLLGGAAVLAVCISYGTVAPELHRVAACYEEREACIAAEAGQDLMVEPITSDCPYSSYSLFPELSTDPGIWPNTAVANYYGLGSIAAEPISPQQGG